MTTVSSALLESPPRVRELERLGDEIAELSAHLDAATARLLDLIREFDARGGWNTGFRSCAEWLSWRVGLDLGAATPWSCSRRRRCTRRWILARPGSATRSWSMSTPRCWRTGRKRGKRPWKAG
jgi:hypothetical protein